jgi:hypothetical protein
MDEEKKQRVAAFRYGIIADFVGGVHLDYGDKERLLKEKTSRLYEIPFSRRRTLSKPTIISWVRRYKAAGNRIEGLYPKSRRDMGSFRSLEPSLRMAIKQVLADEPRLTVNAIEWCFKVVLMLSNSLIGPTLGIILNTDLWFPGARGRNLDANLIAKILITARR